MDDPTRIQMSTDPTQRRFTGRARHGNTPFDVPFISQIAEGLWSGGCENGLVLPNFISHVVSLYPWEQYTVRHDLKSSLTLRLFDSTEFDPEPYVAAAEWVNTVRSMQTGPILVHCQAGLNRSGFVVALAMMMWGNTADEAIGKLRQNRSKACLCNPAFEKWLQDVDLEELVNG